MLNDSKEIAATLYLSSAILAVVLVISVALDDRLNVYSAGYCYGVPLSTSVVLIVVFFSKVREGDKRETECVCACVLLARIHIHTCTVHA